MEKKDKSYLEKFQETIDSKQKGQDYTTAKIFEKQWTKYDKWVVDGILSEDEAKQKKKNFGRAFTSAVKNGEFENIEYTGKNKQKASTFRIF